MTNRPDFEPRSCGSGGGGSSSERGERIVVAASETGALSNELEAAVVQSLKRQDRKLALASSSNSSSSDSAISSLSSSDDTEIVSSTTNSVRDDEESSNSETSSKASSVIEDAPREIIAAARADAAPQPPTEEKIAEKSSNFVGHPAINQRQARQQQQYHFPQATRWNWPSNYNCGRYYPPQQQQQQQQQYSRPNNNHQTDLLAQPQSPYQTYVSGHQPNALSSTNVAFSPGTTIYADIQQHQYVAGGQPEQFHFIKPSQNPYPVQPAYLQLLSEQQRCAYIEQSLAPASTYFEPVAYPYLYNLPQPFNQIYYMPQAAPMVDGSGHHLQHQMASSKEKQVEQATSGNEASGARNQLATATCCQQAAASSAERPAFCDRDDDSRRCELGNEESGEIKLSSSAETTVTASVAAIRQSYQDSPQEFDEQPASQRHRSDQQVEPLSTSLPAPSKPLSQQCQPELASCKQSSPPATTTVEDNNEARELDVADQEDSHQSSSINGYNSKNQQLSQPVFEATTCYGGDARAPHGHGNQSLTQLAAYQQVALNQYYQPPGRQQFMLSHPAHQVPMPDGATYYGQQQLRPMLGPTGAYPAPFAPIYNHLAASPSYLQPPADQRLIAQRPFPHPALLQQQQHFHQAPIQCYFLPEPILSSLRSHQQLQLAQPAPYLLLADNLHLASQLCSPMCQQQQLVTANCQAKPRPAQIVQSSRPSALDLSILPIQAEPTKTRQAYGMDKVWLDEFELLFSQLMTPEQQIIWNLVEVESNPVIVESSNILDYRGRYLIRAAPVADEKGASPKSDSSDDDERLSELGRIGRAETAKTDEEDQHRLEAPLSLSIESDNDSGAVLDQSSAESTGNDQATSDEDSTSDDDSSAKDSSASANAEQAAVTIDTDSNGNQDKRTIPTRFRMFIDSAKVRFCCDNCGHGWTSMKGRVVFWYELFEVAGELPSASMTDGMVNGPLIGYCAYKLFGQQCDICKIENRFERPMWYPEEVCKVLNNLFNKIGQIYFNFKMPTIDKQRRAGKPKTSHNSLLCQACHDGVCTDRK